MGKVRLDISMSLDGFTAGANDGPEHPLGEGGERLHDWMFAGATDTGRRIGREVFDGAGAVLMGRRVFDLGQPHWGRDTFRGLPVVVITHRPQDPIAVAGGSTFTFATDVAPAHAQARAAAGDRDVVVIGGAVAGRQLLARGLVDELRLHLVHVLLGSGTPLFEAPGAGFRRLPLIRLVEDAGVTHLTFDASHGAGASRP